MNYSTIETIHELHLYDILNLLKGSEVTLLIANQAPITGIIYPKADYTKAQTKVVKLEKITGREYFDLLIPKEQIQGIITRRNDAP